MVKAFIIDMKPVRIFRHIDCEGPGYFAEAMTNYSIPYQIVNIDRGESVPTQVDDVSALVFMGGSMSVNDELPWIKQELTLIQRAAEQGIPMLGHCLGGQLLSKGLGGTVSTNRVKEIGWLPVEKIPGEVSDDWLAGIADENLLFHWHGERFSIPPGATAILKSQHCPHQAFVMNNILALQCHVEMNTHMVREWIDRYRDELSHTSETLQGPESILENLDQKIARLQTVADSLYPRWLQGVAKSEQ